MKKIIVASLVVATLLSPISAGAAGTYYTIKRGENLGLIAKKNCITVNDILKANKSIKKQNNIKVGQKIVIPTNKCKKPAPKPVPKPALKPAPKPVPQVPKLNLNPINYTVQTGDTVTSIQNYFGMTSTQFNAANPTITTITTGQVVKIIDNSNKPLYKNQSTYTVQVQDTGASIALKLGMTITQLAQLNPQVGNWNALFTYQVLNIVQRPFPAKPATGEAVDAMTKTKITVQDKADFIASVKDGAIKGWSEQDKKILPSLTIRKLFSRAAGVLAGCQYTETTSLV